jgi:hypothetical protein
VLAISRKSFLPLALAAAMTVAVTHQPAFAQAAQGGAQGAQKNWKDRAEYDLYDAISKETASCQAPGTAEPVEREVSDFGVQ